MRLGLLVLFLLLLAWGAMVALTYLGVLLTHRPLDHDAERKRRRQLGYPE